MKLTAILALLVLVFGLGACGSPEKLFEKTAISGEPLTTNYDFLWDVTRDTLERANFRIREEDTNKDSGQMETEWRAVQGTFRYEAKRHRLVVKVVKDDEDSEGRYMLKVQVLSQRNESMERAMDPIDSDWEDIPPDPLLGEQVIFRVRNYFRDGDGS